MTAEQQDSAQPYDLKGDTYSWGKTARKRTEPAFLEVYKQSPDDIWAVDLGSSYPHYRELMTGQHRQRMQVEARRLVSAFVNDLNVYPRKIRIPFLEKLSDETINGLKKSMLPKHGVTRELLDTAVFELLVDPPTQNQRDLNSISNTLYTKFMHSDKRMVDVVEPDGKRGDKGNWVYIAVIGKKITLPKILGSVLKETTPEAFLEILAENLGSRLVSEGVPRKVTFLSLDSTPFNEIVERANNGFPPRHRKTLFFHSAQRKDRHIRADILRLPFKPNHVAFFSSIEGWPYYFRFAGREENLSVAEQISEQLTPGGRAVFFPWQMEHTDFRARDMLSQIEKMWQMQGLEVKKEGLSADEMRREMTDRELVLSDHSPLFRYSGVLTTLTLSKPTI